MARRINRLSARAVATAKAVGLYGDGGNLYLQVSDVGGTGPTKSWAFRYRLSGRSRKMGMGSVNDFSLAEARERARQARQMLADGRDPIEERLAKRDADRRDDLERLSFKAAAEKFLSVHEAGWKNLKHRQQWRNTLSSYAFPSFGNRPVKAVDDALINAALTDIWRETPETASRVRQRIGRICEWVRTGMPLPAPSKTKRVTHHAALPWGEIPAFMAELRQRDSISACALEWTVLTAARTSETIGAEWQELDLDARTWVIPAERMKGHREHSVPLSDRCVEILRKLPREAGSPYVFAGAKAQSPLSNMAMLELVRSMRPGLTTHGFRSAFKDWASETTVHPREVTEMALAHAIGNKVEAAYRRGVLMAKRRRLMADWSAFCSEEMPRADVVPLRQPA